VERITDSKKEFSLSDEGFENNWYSLKNINEGITQICKNHFVSQHRKGVVLAFTVGSGFFRHKKGGEISF